MHVFVNGPLTGNHLEHMFERSRPIATLVAVVLNSTYLHGLIRVVAVRNHPHSSARSILVDADRVYKKQGPDCPRDDPLTDVHRQILLYCARVKLCVLAGLKGLNFQG